MMTHLGDFSHYNHPCIVLTLEQVCHIVFTMPDELLDTSAYSLSMASPPWVSVLCKPEHAPMIVRETSLICNQQHHIDLELLSSMSYIALLLACEAKGNVDVGYTRLLAVPSLPQDPQRNLLSHLSSPLQHRPFRLLTPSPQPHHHLLSPSVSH